MGIFVPNGLKINKIQFVTPENLTLQLGIHNRKKGEQSKAHRHLPIPILKDVPILEAFFVESGKVRINFFDKRWKKIRSILLKKGDIFVNTSEAHIDMPIE